MAYLLRIIVGTGERPEHRVETLEDAKDCAARFGVSGYFEERDGKVIFYPPNRIEQIDIAKEKFRRGRPPAQIAQWG